MDKDLTPGILKKAKSITKNIYQKETSRLLVEIPPVINIYHEIAMKRTIVEIQVTDRIGLLFELAKCIFEHGFDITFARISTQRDAAVDIFHIVNIDGDEAIESSQLMTLREALSNILHNTDNKELEADSSVS